MKTCPHCNCFIEENATFCPHCGSDKNTGWKEGAEFADEELPDYDEIIENEFGYNSNGKKVRKQSLLTIVAAIIVASAFLAAMIMH